CRDSRFGFCSYCSNVPARWLPERNSASRSGQTELLSISRADSTPRSTNSGEHSAIRLRIPDMSRRFRAVGIGSSEHWNLPRNLPRNPLGHPAAPLISAPPDTQRAVDVEPPTANPMFSRRRLLWWLTAAACLIIGVVAVQGFRTIRSPEQWRFSQLTQ